MHKSILVLEESAMVHDLFESALPKEYWDWRIEHESFPEKYVSKAEDMLPGIIFLSNQDQKNDYVTVKELRTSAQLKNIPILLLTIAKDKLDEKRLRSLGIQGFLRKPFESATLLEQIEAILQNQQLQKDPLDELENIDIIDDELMGLLSKNPTSEITIDSLEGELDPTLQLLPIEAESMLLDDEDDQLDAFEEMTVLVEEEDEGSLDENVPEEFDMGEDSEDELDEFEQDRAETEAIEIELEEIGLEIDDYSSDLAGSISDDSSPGRGQGVTEIAIVIDSHANIAEPLMNRSAAEIGLMEIKVIPFEAEELLSSSTESQFETAQFDEDIETSSILTDEAEFLTELKVTHTGPEPSAQPRNGSIVKNTTDPTESSPPFTELEVSHYQEDDVIEIEHTEITDEIDDDDDAVYEEEFDDSELLEISVEGIDTEGESKEVLSDEDPLLEESDFGEDEELLAEDMDGNALPVEDLDEPDVEMDAMAEQDLSEIVISNVEDEDSESFLDDEDLQEVDGIEDLDQFEQEEGEAEPPFIEQDEMDNLEVDFEADEASQPEEGADDEFDLQMDEFENLDSDNAQMSIQEMINFRQVMKAKYDIPETSTTESEEEDNTEEDLEIGMMSDDEIDHLDLAETSEEAESSPPFEEDPLDEDMDMILEEFADEDESLENDEAEADPEEVDIFADTEEYDTEEVDIFAETEDDDTEEVDIFADVEDDDTGEIDIFADAEDDNTREADIFSDDEAQDDNSLEEPDEDLFLSGDEENEEDGVSLLVEDETLTDDTDFEELDDDPFSDSSEMEDDTDFLAEESEMEDDVSIFDDSPKDPPADSDEIDLLADDLQISDDFAETADSEQTQSDESFDSDAGTGLAVDEEPVEPDDLFSEEPAEEPTPDEDASDSFESSAMDGSDDIFSDDEIKDGDDVFEEVDLLEETASEDTESEVAFEPDSMMDQDVSDLEMISETDDVTIEVPQDVFEVGDLKMADITPDPDEETEMVEDELLLEETELTEDIELPSLDEDLLDFPSIGEGEGEESDILFEGDDQFEPEQDADQSGIEVLQSENDFESFPDESETIDFSGEPSTGAETETIEAAAPIAKKKSPILSPDVRDKLSGMIENIISDTIQNTLHEMLPDMMDKIIQEELDD